MFERFTDRARRIVILAEEEARLRSHHYVGTEHLLIGLVREGDGVAGQVLTKKFGFTVEKLRADAETIIGRGEHPAPEGHIPFTPRSKKTLEYALREALQLGHSFVGTEHILLGLIRLDEGIAAKLLQDGAGPLDGVREAVMVQLGVLPAPPTNVRLVGTAIHGEAIAKWGSDAEFTETDALPRVPEDMIIVRAPVRALNDLVTLVTTVRDEIAVLDQARVLLERFGYTVVAPTPPPAPE